ncbi:MAG: hypothetical protein R3C01_02320 [Planctomycetaceae bacterium]
MNVQIIVKGDGREVADFQEQVSTLEALEFELHTEKLKDRVGRVVLEVGFQKCADQLRHPCCCGRPMRNHGRRVVTVTTQSGPVAYERTRYRCRSCRAWQTPVDALIFCAASHHASVGSKHLPTGDARTFHATRAISG